MSKVQSYQIEREQIAGFMSQLGQMMAQCHDDGEWVSASLNLTSGPKEGPCLTLCLFPGTTKENAIGIQNTLAQALASRNE